MYAVEAIDVLPIYKNLECNVIIKSIFYVTSVKNYVHILHLTILQCGLWLQSFKIHYDKNVDRF